MAVLVAVWHEQCFEATQSVGTDHVALVGHQAVDLFARLALKDIEVVQPEVGHHFLQLTLAVDRAQYPALQQLVLHHLARIIEGNQGFALIRGHSLFQSGALDRRELVA